MKIKHNNKGFSLIELIIVIAILSIVTSTVVVSVGYLYNTNVKSTLKKMNSALLKTQSYTTTKSLESKDIALKITKDSTGCVLHYVDSSGADIPGMDSEKIGNNKICVALEYSDGSSQVVDTSTPGYVYYDRATGGVLQDGGKYLQKVYVSNNAANPTGSNMYITISKITGSTDIYINGVKK